MADNSFATESDVKSLWLSNKKKKISSQTKINIAYWNQEKVLMLQCNKFELYRFNGFDYWFSSNAITIFQRKLLKAMALFICYETVKINDLFVVNVWRRIFINWWLYFHHFRSRFTAIKNAELKSPKLVGIHWRMQYSVDFFLSAHRIAIWRKIAYNQFIYFHSIRFETIILW